ncbi:hypothetical protein WR25_23279 [Diploscapter pachys]|uniref:ET module n=1 Tax=Diploscapter pachys TaxID=2018661 RepID=A0A2A2KMM1_9BILA|nr:hypothetical protein WR25_23279 [Diploscapter pachys]
MFIILQKFKNATFRLDFALGDCNIACYVGYYASDQFTIGDLVQCGQNSVCMKVNGTASGYSVEVYACMPQTLCTALFPGIQDNQELCSGVNGTTITGCCCTKQDCKDLMNPSIPPPPTQNWGGPTIQCYSARSASMDSAKASMSLMFLEFQLQ